MPSVTIRPQSTVSGATTVTPSGTNDSVMRDDSDASWWATQQNFQTVVGYSGFTLPAGSIVKSVTPRVRLRWQAGVTSPGDTTIILGIGGSNYNTGINGTSTTFATIAGSAIATSFTQAQINAATMAFNYTIFNSSQLIAEGYLDIIYADQPTASAVTPSGAITTTRQPTIGWTFTQGTDGAGGQTYFRVKIFSAAQYGAGGFDPNQPGPSYDSGLVNSASVSHVLSSPLPNGVTYKAYVMVWQTTSGTTQNSAWAVGSAFNIAITVPVPTAVTPANATTVTTSRPTLGASVAAMTGGSTMRREWQFASDSGFTANLLTVTEPVGNLTATPSAPFAFPALPTRRAQGVWFLRARALDQDGIYGAYTTTGQSFTIAHAPTTGTRTPFGGATIQYSTTPRVDWTFSDIDTDDFQTKYQVQMWKTSAPGTVLDSGLVVSGNLFHVIASGIDTTWKNTELRWKVAVYDQDAVTAGYSIENTFYMRDLPVVAVTNPGVGAVITTPAPLVTWTNTFSGSATQAQFKVDIIRASVVQVTSGWIAGTALLWQVPTPVVTIGPTHQVTVSVIDSNGLQGSTTNNFTATYAATTIPTFTVSGTQFAASGLNIIDWTTATADANFLSWKVLRRNVGSLTWTNLFETQTVGTRIYRDFLAPSLQPVEYVVVQTDINFGTPVESVYIPQAITGTSTRYQLVCPSLESLNMTLYQVHTDSFGDEQESATINLIGRGRRVEYGSNYGTTGSLTASLRDVAGGVTARQQRLQVEALRDSQRIVYFRNPFGDVFQVFMASARFDRVSGVGMLEYMELSLDYVEITA